MFRKTDATTACKEARLRRKLVNNELNPIADAILSLILLLVTPFIWMFAAIHDKLMFKFLNKTYIYNVSWEVSYHIYISILIFFLRFNLNILFIYLSLGSTYGSACI